MELILDDRALETRLGDLSPDLQGLELRGHINVVRAEVNTDILAHRERRIDRKTEWSPNRQAFLGHFSVDVICLSDELGDEVCRGPVKYFDGRSVLLDLALVHD